MKYQFPEGVIGTVFLCVVIIDIMVEIPGNTIDDETHGQHLAACESFLFMVHEKSGGRDFLFPFGD
ncbi:MAG: hypothetical protein K2P76_03935 [Lachnospiraceae bacterium]|nr:hypothetical protein [Lachnospiraceae bacterium]MDE6980696.1 hypothetical protein [Lachnospiraceae bacterium]